MRGTAQTSTPMNNMVPVYSKRKSSLLEWPVDQASEKEKEFQFEIKDKDTSPANRCFENEKGKQKAAVVYRKMGTTVYQILNIWRGF